jgi:hypothetical protein
VAGLTCVGISFDVEFNVAEYWFSRIQMDYVNTEALSGSSWYYFDPGAFAASGTYPDFFGSGYLTVTGDGEGGGDVSTPEPSTLALLAVPLLAIFGLRRRAARQS